MSTVIPFNEHIKEYEEWFDEYPFVYKSEVEAIREMLPKGENLTGVEIGLCTGRFSQALGIKEGIEPSFEMRKIAKSRGIDAIEAVAEVLPYNDQQFDFVLMNFCACNFEALHLPFKEAYRILKNKGSFIIAFVDQNSIIGRTYEINKQENSFYKHSKFYSVEKVMFELHEAGFKQISICQTLFNDLDHIKEFEPSKPGYGEGSYIVLQAKKRKILNKYL